MENMENNNYENEPSFEKFCQEAQGYFNELAQDLGHPNEENRVIIAWRAVMHTIRERIEMSESLDLISSLPMLLKGMYVHNWKFHQKPPLDFEDMEGMENAVKKFQDQYGEVEFNWEKPTEEIVSIVLHSLKKYVPEGNLRHIEGQMPKEVQAIFEAV